MLYFASEVKSNEIGPADIIELHLDPCRTKSSFASEAHRSIRFGPRSRSYCFVSCNNGGAYTQCDSIASLLQEGMSWSVSITATGYIIEAALPFYALSDLDFPNLRFGLDVTTRSGGSPAQFHAWANSREYNRYNPSEWGTIVLHQAMLPIKIAMIIGMVITALVSIAIAVVVIRHFFLTERYEREEAKGGSEAFQAIETSVKGRLADRNLTIGKVAAGAGLSTGDVIQTLREELDCSFERFLCFRRINAAKGLLWNFNIPLATVAEQCGFASTEEMTGLFQHYLKTDPGSFREKNRDAAFDEGDLADSTAMEEKQ
jgi:AraC-like DNA-binding protein